MHLVSSFPSNGYNSIIFSHHVEVANENYEIILNAVLSLSKVLRAEAKAMGKVSCDSTEDCEKAAGACFSSGKCDYEAAVKVFTIDACSKDSDCTAPCDVQCKNANKTTRFAQCIGGSCVCVCQTL